MLSKKEKILVIVTTILVIASVILKIYVISVPKEVFLIIE